MTRLDSTQLNGLTLTELRQTCGACPSQWEGTLEDGRAFYARYRWGVLTWGVGDTDSEAVDASVEHAGVELGDGFDGTLSTFEMLRETGLRRADR